MAPTITHYVFTNQHHDTTKRVLNARMATIGERIQRARRARDNMSAHALALAVGYKTQSGISNLENSGKGAGGRKLTEIARVLRVPVAWLLEGPDDGPVPFTEPMAAPIKGIYATQAHEEARSGYKIDASLAEAVDLFQLLRTEQRLLAIKYMRELASGKTRDTKQDDGESDPVPHERAA